MGVWAHAADLMDPPALRWATPGDLAVHLEPNTRQTPALRLIDQHLAALGEGACDRLIINLPPQEGKSSRCSRWYPLWLLHRNPDLRIGIVSYELGLARLMGGQIRDDIATYGPELGLSIREDTAAKNEWRLDGHTGGVYAVGIGGALTGRPVDVLIIDDPLKDWQAAQSETLREAAWFWWLSVGFTRLAPGAIVVEVQTRWHADDLAGRLSSDPETGGEWTVLNIPALADHDPGKGEVDLLGREPGEWLTSARGRTVAMWERIRRTAGSRVFAALHQGRPSPAEGDILQRSWWKFYDQPVWQQHDDGTCWTLDQDVTVALSWDMAFKDTDTSDFVVGQVWVYTASQCWLVDQVRARMSFTDTLHAVRGLAAKWPQAGPKWIEDKANGTAVINMLTRTIPGILPVEPDGGKAARAQAVAPFVEAGNVWLPAPELCPWVMDLVEEAAAFPNGSNDDQVDALTQALNRMLLSPWQEPQIVEDATFDNYTISRY